MRSHGETSMERPRPGALSLVFAALALLPGRAEAQTERTLVRYQWTNPGLSLIESQQVRVLRNTEGAPTNAPGALTASFSDVPAEHDGESRFRFTLAFSEDVGGLSFRTLRDSAFEVTSGDVKRALRHVEGSNERWTIEVEPGSRADVVITLPETTDCEAEGAVCAPDGRMLSPAVSETVSGPPAETLAPLESLTAVFQDVPAEHDGSTSFTVRLAFSEELASGSGRKVGSALTLTGARRGYVERVGKGRDLYSFPVRPSGNGTVTLTLSASASDCAASAAVCTPDGRMLSAAVSAAVQGPPGLPVEDAEVDEGNPNILLYMADDMTWRDANTFGNAAVHTPTLDRLAEEGTTFTHVFTATAMCSPTRHMLYNGQYPVRSGAYPNHAKARLRTKSMVHYLRALGYRVGLAGKSHVAPDSVYRFERLSWGHPDLDAIRRFITRSTSQPFALIVAVSTKFGGSSSDAGFRAWMEDQGDKGLETELEAPLHQVTARSSLVPAQVPCAYTVTPSHRDVLWPAGTGEVRVTTSSTCAWTAASESVFLAVTSGAAGTGSGTVTWAVAGNAGGPRTGSLVVAGERVTVFQASPTEFTDHPIDRGMTPVRAVHFLELRARVDALRMGAGLPELGWTDPVLVPGVTPIKQVHLAELRTALLEVYVAAGRPAPIYSTRALTSGTTVIAAVDVMEVRAAVSALDN